MRAPVRVSLALPAALTFCARRLRRRKVQHRKTGQWFALKTIFLNRATPELLEQLRDEITFLRQLDHPNIAKLIDVYSTKSCLYLVMELCSGGELFYRLKARKQLSEADVHSLARQMFSAVRYLHSKGICHRDIKCVRAASRRAAGALPASRTTCARAHVA